MIGHTLDNRYLILRQIGQGGMGAVYEARHVGTNRRVAVKVILAEMMAGEHLARFQREARIVGAVESQHITQVLDTGVDPATRCPYIAMEFLDGDDVGHVLRRIGPMPFDLVLRAASQALAGLARAHDAGVVHRDIKSGNLFLHKNEPGQRIVKLLDFGIAKVGNELGDGGVTKTGALVGSPLYMSPEQARGQPVDPRSDIFSLGITMYEMLGGRRPNDDITQLGELILKICSEPARWLQDVAPWVPAELAGIVHKALAIDPSARYQSAAEMAAAIKMMLPHGNQIEEAMLTPLHPQLKASAAPRGSPLENTGNPRALSVAGMSTTGITQAPSPKKSVAAFVIGGAIFCIAAGAGITAFFLRGAGPEVNETDPTREAPAASPTASSDDSAQPVSSAPEPAATEAPAASATATEKAEPTATAQASTTTKPPSVPVRPTVTKTAAPPPTTTVPKVTKPKSDDETSRK